MTSIRSPASGSPGAGPTSKSWMASSNGGARIVQLREKDLCERDFFRLAEKFRERTAKAGMLLIINDRVDVAIAVGADGVHLGQEDFPVPAALKIAPDLLIGASSHNLEEALRAQDEGADYVNIGPIFPTGTKEGVKHFLGPGAIAQIDRPSQNPFYRNGRHKGIQHKTGAGDGGRKGCRGDSHHTSARYSGSREVFSKNNQRRVAFFRSVCRPAPAPVPPASTCSAHGEKSAPAAFVS